MGCLKCGRETSPDQVFCDTCLAEMERCPVQPGTVVHIPQRRESLPRRSSRRRAPSLEEQVKSLRARLRVMTVLFLLTLALAGILAYPAAKLLFDDRPPRGQNYSSINTNTDAAADVSRETSGGTP